MQSTEAEKVMVGADRIGLDKAKWEALKQLGWFQLFDVVMLLAIFSPLVVLFFYWIFVHPTAISLIAAMLVDIFLAIIWLIALQFRCSCFVLEMRGEVNLMPESAARIVAGYFSAGNIQTPRTRK